MASPTDNDDFEALLREQAAVAPRRVQVGEKVRGTVVHVGEKTAVIDLGGGLEGMIDLAPLKDKHSDPNAIPQPGSTVEAYVVKPRGRTVDLAFSLAKGSASLASLETAAESGLPVEGTVTATNKGGFSVDVDGTAAFCPFALMDVRRVEDPQKFVGQRLRFKVAAVREASFPGAPRDVVLTRRALIEEEQARKAQETRKNLVPGARVQGTVTAVREFGAFVDLGGIEGFVPASELAFGRVKPETVVNVGEPVEVQVLRVEPSPGLRGERVLLSKKAVAQDPFHAMLPVLEPGVVLQGTVTRVEAFGAFVELVPGVEGLVHVSAFGRRVKTPSEVAQPAMQAVVRVDAVDPLQRRIGLAWIDPVKQDELVDATAVLPSAPPGVRVIGRARQVEGTGTVRRRDAAIASDDAAARLAQAPVVPVQDAPRAAVGQVIDVTVDRVETYGVFVAWPGGRGLVPSAETGLAFGADLRKALPVGAAFKAAVVEVRTDGKVRLSRKAAADAEERAEAQAWLADQARTPKTSQPIGSLGEALLAKLGKSGLPVKK
jgi:small subunit ribosomal protein S1